MVIGHYAAALAAKAVERRAPLWTFVLAAQLIDIVWAGLTIVGVENFSLDPGLPGSPLVLYHMPWTHSLPGAISWSVAAALLAWRGLKFTPRAALLIGLVVFSHWAGDLLVHRPDLTLWLGGPKVGFGLWNAPVAEQVVEMGLLILASAAWTWRSDASLGKILTFLVVLVGLQLAITVSQAPQDPTALATLSLVIFGLVTGVATLADRGGGQASLPHGRDG